MTDLNFLFFKILVFTLGSANCLSSGFKLLKASDYMDSMGLNKHNVITASVVLLGVGGVMAWKLVEMIFQLIGA